VKNQAQNHRKRKRENSNKNKTPLRFKKNIQNQNNAPKARAGTDNTQNKIITQTPLPKKSHLKTVHRGKRTAK